MMAGRVMCAKKKLKNLLMRGYQPHYKICFSVFFFFIHFRWLVNCDSSLRF